MSAMNPLTERELLLLHLEAVWSIAMPPLVGDDVELSAAGPLPPWSLYQAQLAHERVCIWRPGLTPEQRDDLLQRVASADVVYDASIGMRREVVLRLSTAPGAVTPPTGVVVRLLSGDATGRDAALLETFEARSAPYFLDPERAPCIGVIVAGRLVSVAHSSRRTSEACELGINTLPDARRYGFAALATRRWTQGIVNERLVPIYSAFAHNVASLRLAASTGFVRCCEGVYGPVAEAAE